MICSKQNRLLFTEKAHEIIKSLTLEEKVFLLSGSFSPADQEETHYNDKPYLAGGLHRADLPALAFCDGPHGVVCGTGQTTSFPVTMLRGASFDLQLEEKIGRAIALEIKAFGGNLFGGVCINLPYHPGWGRSQETYGEDSYHIGEMGSALVRGVQAEHVIAAIKHFAFNQMEISRFKVNIDCDIRTEREVFFPHFKKCIESGAAAVMSAYNAYKGTPCGHHEYLLNQVLKQEWDFDGFVFSDFMWGIKDTVEPISAGLDLEMNWTKFYGSKLVTAVLEGKVKESRIDDAALRIVRTLLSFKDAQNVEKIRGNRTSVLASKQHIELARQSAREGITLVKNEDNILPLNSKKTDTIAVFGRLAEKDNLGDHGSSRVFPPYTITPLQGIANAFPHADVLFYNDDDVEHAQQLASDADAVVFVVGYDHDDEGEYITEFANGIPIYPKGGDRTASLGLHRYEEKLIEHIAPYNSNSIVVLIGGNMIMLEHWAQHVKGILMAYYPGMEGGTALGEILSGKVNPSGKLPFIIPHKETDLPSINWETEYQHYDYYHGYTKLEKDGVRPAYSFGYGLSYTTFQLNDPVFLTDNRYVKASCKIQNTGSRPGTEVVQLYIGFRHSSIDRPVKLLRGFKRVDLKPSEISTVTLVCHTDELRWYNPATGQWDLEKMDYEVYIGTSSADEDLLAGVVSIQ